MKNILMVVALLVTSLAAPALAQDDMMRWDGADDLDVNPLACPGAEMPARARR